VRAHGEVKDKTGVDVKYALGTMIELPRAALRAAEIAEIAEFFSFGTNDLTQTALGLSRDDAGSFLDAYEKAKIVPIDPFISIDVDGVGELVRIGTERGRSVRPDLKIGICGEHGGDPASVHFCQSAGLDYVSCSPYRVPIARLAAAQAALTEKAPRTKGAAHPPAARDRNRRLLAATGRRPSGKRLAKTAAARALASAKPLEFTKPFRAATKKVAKKPKAAPKRGPSKPSRGKGKKKR
jgi:phosphoenolpyruvate-protein kinase (PTS system EI component)